MKELAFIKDLTVARASQMFDGGGSCGYLVDMKVYFVVL